MTILGILLIIQGVWSSNLTVEYQSQCAFKGTSVTIPCSYSLPPGKRVTLVTWYRGEPLPGGWNGNTFFNSSSMKFQYLGDTSGSCTLRINRLLDSDQAGYFVILKTDDKDFISPHITLTVEDPGITAVVPTVVVERDMVSLICKTKCIGYPPANMVVWSRDGKVAGPTFRAGLDDAGSYQCAWEGLQSNTVTLDVQSRASIFIRSGVVVTVLVALTVLVCFCSRKQPKTKENQHSVATRSPIGMSLNSSTNPNLDPLYANISSLPNRSLAPPQVLHDVHTHDSAQERDIGETDL
ncbi:unnamed protein product [Arctogadus glacialis]